MFNQYEDPSMKKLLLLKNDIPYFKGLLEEEIIDLVDNIKIMQYTKGAYIIQEGSNSSRDIYFLLKGDVDIIKLSNGNEIKITTLGDPGVFGEMAAVTNEPRSTSIVAGKKGAMVLSFCIKKSQDKGRTLFYKNVIEELSKKIKQMNKKSFN